MRAIRRLLLCIVLLAGGYVVSNAKQKLVVISLDQFPHEYLTRYHDHYGSQGFKYSMLNGAGSSNAEREGRVLVEALKLP